jgi:BirA family biotin operon repressor/biotin-[acetyl-CoA-carboxylase] ligase
MSISWKIENYSSLPSTQDVVLLRAMQDGEEGLVIQTMTQTAGRGRHGNQWESPMGGLYMSILLKPDCNADQAAQLAFVISIALSKAMDKYILKKYSKKLKWPNDILVDNKKLAGILLESDIDYKGYVHAMSVGIGLNVLSAPDDATFLKEISSEDKKIAIHPVRDTILKEIDIYYSLWKEKGFKPIRELWLKEAYGVGEEIQVRLPDKEINGIFKGIKTSGELIVQLEDKTLTINSGDVHFPKQNP